jgi:LacI family transcriptional regulator
MVTQKDVAKYAGVSFITVSRVVNKEQNVKEETRLRVEKAIQDLGYFPAFAGQALNSGLCKTIAVLTPINFEEDIRASYLMGIMSGINNSCRKHSCDIMFTTFSEDDPNFDYLRPFRQHKVDGIIYVGLKIMPPEMLDEIRTRKLQCVVIGDRPENELLSWIDTDNLTAGYETTKRIWEMGHRRIFFHGLNKDIYNANITDREIGFKKAYKELSGKDVDESMIIRSDYTGESIAESFRKAFSTMEKSEMPTAIFCSTDNRMPPAIKELKRCGLSVPKDVSLVGFDGFINNSQYYDFTLATNAQPLFDMGNKAADILFSHIKDPSLPRCTELFSVPFEAGDSLTTVKK